MPKRYFDAIVIVPLEEEFEAALDFFLYGEDLSKPDQIRFAVTVQDFDLTVLMVKQNAPGRTECNNAATAALAEYDAGVLICLGIAGGLSSDICIGDVCFTGSIIDLLDNSKVTGETAEIAFSPVFYDLPIEISVGITLDRVRPSTKQGHEAWRKDRFQFGKAQITGTFTGKEKQEELIHEPNARQGTIACGAVSGSPEYNKKIKAIDRKVLAIETESGGLFAAAKLNNLPAFTVRGIADYAGSGFDKNLFEQQTNSKARLVAACNAASFLARQLRCREIREYFLTQRARSDHQDLFPQETKTDNLSMALVEQGERFDGKLRDLAPSYQLQAKGYRLPVPRVRITNTRLGSPDTVITDPIELRDAVRQSRVVILQIPPQYPDLSLSWIIARDLLLAQIGDRQLIPTVIEGRYLAPPDRGIRAAGDKNVLAFEQSAETQLVFVIDDFNFDSRTRVKFLLQELEALPEARFIIVTRNVSSVLVESEFAAKVAASVVSICDFSFLEIALFLQKNFEMRAPEFEVVAIRLRETFENFKLPVHPTYFAGIPGNTLTALLDANRRAELLELAVAGYLSYVVSQDDQPVALSRTTREKFLTMLAYEISVEKRSFSEAELVTYTEAFAKKYDFKISPSRFIAAFIAKGILHIEADGIRFTLPFMQSYLLAKRLHSEPETAAKYFDFRDPTFDFPAFTISAELGIANSFIEPLLRQMDNCVAQLKERANNPPVLTGDSIFPSMLENRARFELLQKRVQQAVTDIVNDSDQSQEKQKLLDAADRIRESAARMSDENKKGSAIEKEKQRTIEGDALAAWFVAVSFLGAGAERLEAETKRVLIQKIISLACLIADDWTRFQQRVNFEDLGKHLLDNELFVKDLAKSQSEADLKEAKRVIEGLVDVLEYNYLTLPLRVIILALCEEAHDNVLALSIINTAVDGSFEKFVKGIWLSDIETQNGAKELQEALKALPRAKLLRATVAAHLMLRAYWKQWKKDSRLRLLELANECLKSIGASYNSAQLQELLRQEKGDTAKERKKEKKRRKVK